MNITGRERVYKALRHEKPDRTPTDFQAVNEVWQSIHQILETKTMPELLTRLEIDCAWVDPEVGRPPKKRDEQGFIVGWGGSKIRKVSNQYGEYDEIVHYALDGAETPQDIDRQLVLPDLDEWDFSTIIKNCLENDNRFLLGGFASVLYYPTLIRSMEDLMTDLVVEPRFARHMIRRCFDWHIDYHERLFKHAGGRLDAMQLADDFATQRGLLISVEMFREYFKQPMREYVELAKSTGAVPFLHCCGSSYHLIGEFIDIGIKILDPIQTVAADMEPKKLKKEFGESITFHGAGETQSILPHGSPEEVRKNAKMLSSILGRDGGYIMSSCHFLQADVPVENVLAFYEVENRDI